MYSELADTTRTSMRMQEVKHEECSAQGKQHLRGESKRRLSS